MPTAGEWWTGIVSFVVVTTSGLALLRFGRPVAVSPSAHAWELVCWERDRLQSVAGALARGALGFVSSVLLLVLKDEVAEDIPRMWGAGVVSGILGCLLLAAVCHRHAGRWLRDNAGASG